MRISSAYRNTTVDVFLSVGMTWVYQLNFAKFKLEVMIPINWCIFTISEGDIYVYNLYNRSN